MAEIRRLAIDNVAYFEACTPGYYNNEGRDPGPAARYNVGYPEGPSAYFRYLDAWRSRGDFEGLAFR